MSKAQNSPDNKKIKQPFSVVLMNNLYLLKLMLKASPAFVIIPALDAVRGQLSIFFEHTVGIGYVLEAAEKGYPFESVCYVILILAICITHALRESLQSRSCLLRRSRIL